MKSIQLLTRLSENPHYKLSQEEKDYLEANVEEPEVIVPQTSKKKSSSSIPTHGNAAVKEIGKLDKHADDPIAQ